MAGTALIVGTGSGISAAVARALKRDGWRLALAARRPEKLADLARETGALTIAADATEPAQVQALFADCETRLGPLDLVLYNASFRTRGPFLDLDPVEVERTRVGASAASMSPRRQPAHGAARAGRHLLHRRFGERQGLCPVGAVRDGQVRAARSRPVDGPGAAPKGIHVAHFVIDGGVRNAARGRVEGDGEAADSLLDPDAIAETYLATLKQPRSAWSLEVELSPGSSGSEPGARAG